MAVNTTDKALDIAQRLSAAAGQLASLTYGAALDISEQNASAVDFTTVDFSTTALRHLDGASLNAAIGIIQAANAWLDGLSAGAGSPTRRALLLKVRR